MLSFVLTSIAILLAALPLRNWLEIRWVKKEDAEWSNWLSKKPSKEDYIAATNQQADSIECNFCGSNRHLPKLEKN